MEWKKDIPKRRLPKKREPEMVNLDDLPPNKEPDRKVKMTFGDLHNLSWFRNSWKAVANLASRKFTGITIFDKDKVTMKSQSVMDWIIKLIKLIINKLRGKDNG